MTRPKILGILGGLGPMASVYFYELITSLTCADCDQEHISLLLVQLCAYAGPDGSYPKSRRAGPDA